MDAKRYLITAALPYANGPVHIGHIAGCYLPADIYTRYLRVQKRDVKFVCGSDEHGVPITIRAMKEGITPQQVADKYHAIMKQTFADMGISFDIYSRTSNQVHHDTSQAFFLKLYNDGVFEERESEQYYDPAKEMFLADRYIIGTCPICGNDRAYGDQCENCGSSLSPEQLLNPRSALSEAIPEKRKTKHWYFPLDKYEEFLKEWIVTGKKDEWKPNVYGQCKSWLDSGLQPRAMTRDSNWGVPVPLPDAAGKVLYVWFDAPIGYISATKELTSQWSDYWCSEDTKLVHFIGKDNIVFHCIIFPAMLKAHGGFVLPDNVPANEFLNLEGQKISTSRNWAVWVDDYLRDFPDQQDALRYVLCANAPETKDNDFTWKEFQDRVNNELSAVLGNFENRVFVLVHKLCKGRVPPVDPAFITEADKALMIEIGHAKLRVQNALEQYKFRDGLSEVMDLARKGNKYLQDNAPWSLSKTPELQIENQKRIDICLHICLQLTANLAILLNPFLPYTANKMCRKMKVVERMLDWENAGRMDLLKTNYPMRPPELLFRKIEDAEVAEQVDKLNASLTGPPATNPAPKPMTPEQTKDTPVAAAPEATAAPAEKPQITIDEFSKMDLRVGTILKAEKVEKADKLLKLELDMGNEIRTVVSGIALHFKPEDIIGKQVTVVANLAPRKMRGIESRGMILMAQNGDGRLIFVSPLDGADNGSEVR